MRVLHVVPTYLPARRYGGPIFAVQGLCAALAARGHEVHVFTTNIDGHSVSDVPLATPVDLDGVKVRYYNSPFRRLYWSPAMGTALASETASFDLIHLHSVFLWPTAAAAREARRLRVPYVVTPRGMLVGELLQRKSRWVKNAWISLVERRNLAHAAAVHFTSKREWDDAAALLLPLPHPFVIPNGIDPPQTPASTARDSTTILFVGRVNWKKGLDRLIEALAVLDPAVCLVIAGNDEENYTPSLLALAESRKVSGRVTFLGPVDSDTKSHLLRSATLLVLPSYSENFGNVVLEAMAEALPVVVTQEVGLASTVAGAQTGVVTSGDPHSLAGAITALLSDAPRRSEMGARGRDLVMQRFTWAHVAEEMETAYEEIVKRRPLK